MSKTGKGLSKTQKNKIKDALNKITIENFCE